MDTETRTTRFRIMRFCLDNGRPPTVEELTKSTNLAPETVLKSLKQLEDLHHLALYKEGVPSPTPIAMVHPFSHLPTSYHIQCGDKSWWVNCAWCGLGLVSMLLRENAKSSIVLRVLAASRNDELQIEWRNGELVTTGCKDYVAHFSVVPSKYWIDVHYTCSTIQLFQSESQVEPWLSKHGISKGSLISFEQLLGLAKEWYHDKAEYDYDRKSPEQVQELFNTLGMTETFWKQ
ncbi:Alkylmercury lyase domain-containing protein [Trichoderma sp. SZMC 28014]